MLIETPDARLKRLKMRSMRRGIKEMDLILSRFADDRLGDFSDADLTLYDAFLSENDHDLYGWVSGQHVAPEHYAALVKQIAQHQLALFSAT
ncbi:succinate dehydrogenase assembly factor 2 [Pseudoruegeria sp. SK021]|uniref:succinate dehydrogenase assembly factor 2 n=1 Tax=Pseudoruegeria sp. SK021 TaxID=1933035 RepID=UPI000A249ADD|nr:succinate dehydrogenase assembly factor 2 [Pseudoruegeria sp. SK021]OSP56291.1 succinate dehydrogenase assembly factor 2 [Pseudoruegeria sp. SK021]